MTSILRRNLPVDPWRVASVLARRPGTVLLHRPLSASLGWRWGRSVLLFDPRWTAWAPPRGRCRWSGDVPTPTPPSPDPLLLPATLAEGLDRRGRSAERCDLPPVLAGWVGYDAGAGRLGARHRLDAPGAPDDLWLAAHDCAVWFDDDGSCTLEVTDLGALVAPGIDPRERLERATAMLLEADAAPHPAAVLGRPSAPGITPLDRTAHRRGVHAVHDRLRAGDSYQINLTGFVRIDADVHPWEVFRSEVEANPVGYAAYLHTGEHVVASHSPELLLSTRGDRMLTAPIKGTLPARPGAAHALAASAKDRAEHVMIVDLCRNDLGRHAVPGSVRVESLMEALSLRGLVHLVSRIAARVPAHARREVFADLFPGGSVTGAPKRSSCAIISSLETTGRGLYTGAVGAVDAGGGFDWNIAIRTALWQNGAAWFGCGGGIVLDSDPDREYEEAMLKARSFLESVHRAAVSPHGTNADASAHGAP